MIRRPPRATRTDTLFPYTTLFRSIAAAGVVRLAPAKRDEDAVGVRFVDQMVAVGAALRPHRDIARPHRPASVILDQHRLAGDHHEHLVLAVVPVALRGPGTGFEHHVTRGEITEPSIGRAPGRERVCQYVMILVAAA